MTESVDMDKWYDWELEKKKLDRTGETLAMTYMQGILSPRELQAHQDRYEQLDREVRELEATAEQRRKAAKEERAADKRNEFMP
jgi:hypothetical protein